MAITILQEMSVDTHWLGGAEFVRVNKDHWNDWCLRLIGSYQMQLGTLVVVFCTDDELLKLNKQVLDHDYYTDIITFDKVVDNRLVGEIYISLERVIENAEIAQVSFDDELDRVFIHGVLHLIGFNDKTEIEQQEMRNRENLALEIR